MKLDKGIINSDLKEILVKSFKAIIVRMIGFVSGYIYLLLVVKYFGKEINGLLSLSFSIIIIFSLISRLGTDLHITKIFAINDNLNNAKGLLLKIFPILLLTSTAISFALYFFSEEISSIVFNKPRLSIYLKWSSPVIIFLTIILLNAGVLRGLRKNSIYAFLFNGGRFLFTLFFFLIIYFIDKTKSFVIPVIAHTLGMLLLLLVSLFYLIKNITPINFKTKYDYKKFIIDSLPMLASASILILLSTSDTLILGIYKDAEKVGVYNIIVKIAAITGFSTHALNSILAPKLSTAYHSKNMELFKKMIKLSVVVNTLISTVLVVGIIVFNDDILNLFNSAFTVAKIALIILCFGQLINSIYGPVGLILTMTGHQKTLQNVLVLALVLNITLNLILVKPFGIIGVGIATSLSLAFWNLLCSFYVKKKLKIKII